MATPRNCSLSKTKKRGKQKYWNHYQKKFHFCCFLNFIGHIIYNSTEGKMKGMKITSTGQIFFLRRKYMHIQVNRTGNSNYRSRTQPFTHLNSPGRIHLMTTCRTIQQATKCGSVLSIPRRTLTCPWVSVEADFPGAWESQQRHHHRESYHVTTHGLSGRQTLIGFQDLALLF